MTAPVFDPRDFLHRLFDAAVAAVRPSQCIPASLPHIVVPGRTIVLGGGKAAGAMAAAVEKQWRGPLTGLVVTRDGYGCETQTVQVVEAAHPVPDARGMAAGQRILELAREAGPDDLVLALISGGASSLLAVPADGVTLDDKRNITQALLRAGATINELNCVRKHLSGIKGGRLALAAAPARVVTVLISDVVGDDPAIIASGPTVPDPSTCAEALDILHKYKVIVPASIEEGLRTDALETPKRLSTPPEIVIAARPRDALSAAAAEARRVGLAVLDLGDVCEGEARVVAQNHAELAARIRAGNGPVVPPCVILSGGELTVKVDGEGTGGPNTEYVLGLAIALREANNVWAMAGDTDGTDGNAGAAGAIATPTTLRRARELGLSPNDALAQNDSAGFFDALGDLLKTGPTLTNVNDIRVILILPEDGARSRGASK